MNYVHHQYIKIDEIGLGRRSYSLALGLMCVCVCVCVIHTTKVSTIIVKTSMRLNLFSLSLQPASRALRQKILGTKIQLLIKGAPVETTESTTQITRKGISRYDRKLCTRCTHKENSKGVKTKNLSISVFYFLSLFFLLPILIPTHHFLALLALFKCICTPGFYGVAICSKQGVTTSLRAFSSFLHVDFVFYCKGKSQRRCERVKEWNE